MQQLGLERDDDWKPDLSSVKAGFGLDDVGVTLTRADAIAAYEQDRERRGPVTTAL